MRQSGIPRNWFPTIHIVTYGLPRHHLGTKPQPPADVTTMLRVLQLPDDGPVGAAMFNFLVDFQHVERRILVEVSCCSTRQMPLSKECIMKGSKCDSLPASGIVHQAHS